LVTVAVICGLLLALLRRPYTAVSLTLYFVGFALLSSFMKQDYLGSAMTLADMHFFFLRPLENFYILINYPVLGFTALGVLGCAALICFVGLRFEQPIHFASSPLLSRWWRVSTAIGSFVLGLGALLIAERQLQARANDGDAYAAFLSMYEQQHPQDFVHRLNIFFNNRSFEATLPIEREQERFPIAQNPPIDAAGEQMRPDILLVLEESTFDPLLIRSCPKSDCDNAMLHPLTAATRTRQGPLLVHTTGGGTWLAEFAVLSAFDWRIFGRGGAYAPVSLAPRLQQSLPLRLRELGYRTVAIYPTQGNFLSATSAYGYYGFDEFYDADSLKLPSEWGDIRDALVFEKVDEIAKRGNDPRPLFVFALTIRNHGPHGNKPEQIPTAFANAGKQTSIYMADYLARMRDSSVDYVRFASQWLKSSRPSVIAWFGDHQPEAAWDFTEHPNLLRSERATNVTEQQLQYLTYFQFSANYGDRERAIGKDAIDLAYLNVELLAFAGLPFDAGAAAAHYVAAQCNGLLIDCPQRDLVNDYLSFRIHQLGAIK
jgi:phosphoglycerol transferase MdoB-like AlkP superfamily enzyme